MKVIKRIHNIIKSEHDSRLYRALELSNMMKVLLISDATTDISAASLDVNVGSMNDPSHLPGLAHFCEHMLFLGSKKYPAENDYRKFLSEHGGNSNAYTTSEHTNYHFDVSTTHLEGALDRFSQFFISPLFTESATEREVNAVNLEHEKNIPLDNRRLMYLEKFLSIPNHDFSKFATGNKETLFINPKAKGCNVQSELLDFHTKWYSSNIMALAVLGKENLDELENMVLSKFSPIENKEVQLSVWNEHPLGPKQLQKIIRVVPTKDRHTLKLNFPIPDLTEFYHSNPSHYIAHLIGHEGSGSILSYLKSKGWANSLHCGSVSFKGFGFFGISIELSEDGLNYYEEIVLHIFQYFKMLREVGPQEWIFNECRNLEKIDFMFRDTEQPYLYVCGLSSNLQEYPFEEVIYGINNLCEYRPDLIEDVLSRLTPTNCRLLLVSKSFEAVVDQVEEYYGTNYTVSPIPEATILSWENASINDSLQLPPENIFIPEDLSLVPRDSIETDAPFMIMNTEKTRVWYKQDNEFLLPKVTVCIEFESPLVYLDPLNANLVSFACTLMSDALNEYLYSASKAGLLYRIDSLVYGLLLTITGYSDKIHLIIIKILEKLVPFNVDKERFHLLMESHVRGLKNFEVEQPHRHAIHYCDLILAERAWSHQDLLDTVAVMSPEKMEDLLKQLFSCMHVEAMFYGNITQERALSLTEMITSRVEEVANWRPLIPALMVRDRVHQMRDESHFVYECQTKAHKSNAIHNYYDCGVIDTFPKMVAQLFCQIIKEPCFNILRTQEQLGYIVFSSLRVARGCHGINFIVQSDRSPPYVDTRIEAFISSVDTYLQELSEEEFENHKMTLTATRLKKPKKLLKQSTKYWTEIVSRCYNFDKANIDVQCLSTITKDDVFKFYKQTVTHDAPRRKKLSIQVFSTNKTEVEEPIPQNSNPAPPVISSPVRIDSIEVFKHSHGLYPLPRPYIDVRPFDTTKAKL